VECWGRTVNPRARVASVRGPGDRTQVFAHSGPPGSTVPYTSLRADSSPGFWATLALFSLLSSLELSGV